MCDKNRVVNKVLQLRAMHRATVLDW